MELDHFKNLIWDYTRKIAEGSNCAFSPLAEKHGLTMMQVRILMGLKEYEYHTVGSLSEGIGVAGANISAMCKKLETLGLIERIRNQADERVVKIVLTKQGQDIVLDINNNLMERISRCFENESEETLQGIITGLQMLNNLFHKMCETE
jgi:DNA-binding MarR family transcriptional regulator